MPMAVHRLFSLLERQSRGHKHIVMAVIAIIWLLGSGYVLFSYQTDGQRMFDPSLLETPDYPVGQLQRQLLDVLPDMGVPLVVHAWDADCACAAAAREHLVSMAPRIQEAGAELVLLVKPGAADFAAAEAERLAAELDVPLAGVVVDHQQNLVPASPAAMVIAETGQLVYLGPYSAGGACVSTLGGFVESSLRVVRQGITEPWVNRAAIGCYCDWGTVSEPGVDNTEVGGAARSIALGRAASD